MESGQDGKNHESPLWPLQWLFRSLWVISQRCRQCYLGCYHQYWLSVSCSLGQLFEQIATVVISLASIQSWSVWKQFFIQVTKVDTRQPTNICSLNATPKKTKEKLLVRGKSPKSVINTWKPACKPKTVSSLPHWGRYLRITELQSLAHLQFFI